jgi:hypothetical protein
LLSHIRTSALGKVLPLLLALQLLAPGELVLCSSAEGLSFEPALGGRCLDFHAEQLCPPGSSESGPAVTAQGDHGPCQDLAVLYTQLRTGRPAAPAVLAGVPPVLLLASLRLQLDNTWLQELQPGLPPPPESVGLQSAARIVPLRI